MRLKNALSGLWIAYNRQPIDVYTLQSTYIDVYKLPIDVYRLPIDIYMLPINIYMLPIDVFRWWHGLPKGTLLFAEVAQR